MLGVNYIGISKKIFSIFLIAVLLGPLGSFPPLLPTQTNFEGINQALEFAEKIGLLDYLPTLGPVLEAQAQQQGQGKKIGQHLIIDDTMSPLQKGIETNSVNQLLEGKEIKSVMTF